MFQLFRNFNNSYYGNDSLNGECNLITVQNMMGKNIYEDPTTSTKYYVMTQDFESTSTIWSPISNITFCSALIPLNTEQIASPVNYTITNYAQGTTSASLYQPIITDISLPLNKASDWKSYIAYSPTSEYRLASFNGTGPLNAVDISVYWRCKFNQNLYPVTMPNGSSFSMKIMFRKR